MHRRHVCLYLLGFALLALSGKIAFAAPSAALQELLRQIFVDQTFEEQHSPQFEWFDDGAAYTALEKSKDVPDAQDIVRYTTASGKREVLISAQSLIPTGQEKPLGIEGYQFSKDKQRLLIFTNTKPVWRQQTRGDYWLLDLNAKTLERLGGEGEPSSMQFAKFSPGGNAVAFVRSNNLFVQDLADRRVRPLTRDGSHTIINGTSDWVYEEELELRD
ncbi:MAG: DPP IV N-terminal domain-containing protein, partial [Bryobacteraceae bacterium]